VLAANEHEEVRDRTTLGATRFFRNRFIDEGHSHTNVKAFADFCSSPG
jgi:hypothetical protein